ncbi:MAG: hypothetical protein JST16_12895 [Bdellovibrionales bacterium]|nr:hypothetical protein [Bdellovibrionales bacterium]
MQAKKRRQALLISVIQKHKLSTQQELVDHLKKFRIRATQSSVSRDMEELNIGKVQGYYAIPSVAGTALPHRLRSLEPAGDALVVAKCESGHASVVTVAIDRVALPEIVGTIAGDDTIFIAVRGKSAQKAVLDKLRQIFLIDEGS